MNTGDLPKMLKNGACPSPGAKLTSKATGGAFLDGCYMNTTRVIGREEAPGNEAQSYLYMWKHACAYTKWVPSNQFMYSNLDYDEDTMTLERFGFIGMDKKCYWGSIGVLWKRPLPVEQILPNATLISEAPEPKPKPHPPIKKPQPKPKPKPHPPVVKPEKKPIKKPEVKVPEKKPIKKPEKKPIKKPEPKKPKVQRPPSPIKFPKTDKKTKYIGKTRTIGSVKRKGSDVEVRTDDWKTFTLAKGKNRSKPQTWKFIQITKELIAIESGFIADKYFDAYEVNATDGSGKTSYAVRTKQADKNEWANMGKAEYREDPWSWFRLLKFDGKKNVYAIESAKYPGYYMVDPGVNGKAGFELRASKNIFLEKWGMFEIGNA